MLGLTAVALFTLLRLYLSRPSDDEEVDSLEQVGSISPGVTGSGADASAGGTPSARPARQEKSEASGREDTIVQYVVVRKDLSKILKWTPGPIMAQACHASCAALWLSRESTITQAYCSEKALNDMTKVMMEIKNEGQLRKLSDSLTDAVSCNCSAQTVSLYANSRCQPLHNAGLRQSSPGTSGTLTGRVCGLHACRVSGTSSGWNNQRISLPPWPLSPFTEPKSSHCSRSVNSTRASKNLSS